MSDIEQARRKRTVLERLKLGHLKRVAVLCEDVAKEADADCKECAGGGVVYVGAVEELCPCAEDNFKRRRAHQVEIYKGDAYWRRGCPKG